MPFLLKFCYNTCMQNHKIFWFVTIIILIAIATLFVTLNPFKKPLGIYDKNTAPTATSTVPTPDTQQNFTYKNATKDNIVVDLPYPGAVTGKKFTVIGKARGTWYFEASFPVKVLDKDGKVLVTTHATAQDEWMTEDFVPFTSEITVPLTYIGPATLILEKDNPSGDAVRDASVSFPFTIEY